MPYSLNSLVWYVPSLRYTRGLGWRMHCGAEATESSTNKHHHLSSESCPACIVGVRRGNPDQELRCFDNLVTPQPNVLGPKHERQQRPLDSKESRIGVSRGNLGQDLRRVRQSSSWIALWALRMITLQRARIYNVQG